MEAEATGVLSQVVAAFVAQGFVGVVCVVLMAWIYFREKRINELTDKIFTLADASVTANATSAASNNRLADMLSVRRTPE